MVFSGEYIWKYTHNGYDFSVLGNTPITFPMEWDARRFRDYAGRVSVTNFHGFSALVVFSSVAARFFTPQIGGAGAVPPPAARVRVRSASITTRSSTRPPTCNTSPGSAALGSGSTGDMTAVSWPARRPAPAAIAHRPPSTHPVSGHRMTDSFGAPLTADQQFEAGMFCGSLRATPTRSFAKSLPCLAVRLHSFAGPCARTRRTTTRILRASHREVCLISRSDTITVPLPQRPIQDEPATHRHQYHQQVRALQLPLHLQWHALRNTAYANGSDRLPLLTPIVRPGPGRKRPGPSFRGVQQEATRTLWSRLPDFRWSCRAMRSYSLGRGRKKAVKKFRIRNGLWMMALIAAGMIAMVVLWLLRVFRLDAG